MLTALLLIATVTCPLWLPLARDWADARNPTDPRETR